MTLLFGDIVVVEDDLIGVVVKTWNNQDNIDYEVYVRYYGSIKIYPEKKVSRYKVRHKSLNEEELFYQNNA